MSDSLISEGVLSTCLGALASYIGATLDSDSVVTGTPVYSAFGSLVDLTDGLNITQGMWTLDATKQTAIAFKNSSGTTICTNPNAIKLVGLTATLSGRTLTITGPSHTGTFVTNVSVYTTTFAFIHSVVTAVTGVGLSYGTAIVPG